MMDSGEKKQLSIRRTTLIVVLITSFMMPFSMTALNIAVPIIGKEFHSSAIMLGWVISSFMFCTAVLAVPFGRIADIKGRRGILILGILIFAVGSALSIFSTSMPLLIAFRGVQGVGGAMIFATNIAMLIDTFPANMRGRVLGIATAMVYIGASLGPVIGGFITHQFGWRSVLMLITALSVCAFIIAIARLPKEPAQGAGSGAGMGSGVDAGAGDETKQRLGPVSVILYIVSVVLVLYGFTTLTQNIFSYIALGAGAVLLVLFVRYESTAKAPVVQIRLFRGDPNFLLSNLAALLNYSATFAVSYLLSIYLQLVAGYAADVSGLILIAQPIVQAVVAPIAGRISDRRSPYLLASAGMALCAATLFILIFVGIDTSLPVILAALMIAGVGIGLFSPSNTNAIMSSVQPRDYGSASSLTSTMRTFGQVFAMAIITIVMNFVIGNTPIAEVPHEKIVESMHTGFIIFCAICAVGIFISLNRKKGKGAVG